jgi:hypothetical protein
VNFFLVFDVPRCDDVRRSRVGGRRSHGVISVARLWVRCALALTVIGGAVLPVTPALASTPAHLEVSVAFDKEWYRRDDQAHLTFTITNVGGEIAHNARASGNLDPEELTTDWGDLGTGVDIEPGATRVFELTGRIQPSATVKVQFSGQVSYATGDFGTDVAPFSQSAWVIDTFGEYSGVLFGDANVNGVQDPGETGFAGVIIDLNPNLPTGQRRQTTDASGRFRFTDLPADSYRASYNPPYPWSVYTRTGDSLVIDGSPRTANVRVAAVPSLWNTLHASMFFDRDTYQPGETARLTVVLVNRFKDPLRGLIANCDPSGDGWGPLASGAPALTLPPGQAVVVTATLPVPADAQRLGSFQVHCRFGDPRYPPEAFFDTAATVRVPGVPGSGRARIFQDLNNNSMVDEGEAVAGLPVNVTDPETGAVVARSVTDADGILAVDNLPAAQYDLRFDGPWKPRPEYIYGYQLPVVAGGGGEEPSLRVVPGSERDNARPNLRASASFDKPSYRAHETMKVTLTVTNIGEAAAEHVRLQGGTKDPSVVIRSLGELDYSKPGPRIEAGQTRVFEFDGSVVNPEGAITFAGWLDAEGFDTNYENNRFGVAATVTVTRASLSGVLYGDANNNGVVDAGEAFVGTPIGLEGGTPRGQYRATTNERGEFSFPDIAAGRYSANYLIPDGWIIPHEEFLVTEENQTREVRAVRPADGVLRPTMAFTKDSYAVGEQAHLTITITNTGSVDLSGITAFCSGPGSTNEIDSSASWGVIGDDNGPGVTVRAGEIATFDVTVVIPEGGFAWGYVFVGCDFGNPPGHEMSPSAYAEAKVPGAIGNVGGMLLYDRDGDNHDDGDGVADTKVVLVDPATGQAVSRAVTDARGHFMATNVPAGHYDVRVVGPWKIVECWCQAAFGGTTYDNFIVRVVPGAVQPDPDAPRDEPPPVPQAEVIASVFLATTGISVTGLLIGGLATLGAGLALLMVRRRRKA